MTTQYQELLRRILADGVMKGDRTGTGTQSLFGAQLQFDLREGLPLLTTKKVPFRWVAEELFWLLSGSTNEADLRAKGVDIWKEWATREQCERFGREAGDLGPVYGWQWRNFGGTTWEPGVPHPGNGVDQISNALALLQNSPDSRRILVTGWNPKEATQVALPPCHTVFQFGTHEETRPCPECDGNGTNHLRYGPDEPSPCEGYGCKDGLVYRRVLSCHMYQRSADVFLGVPFNIASYALLTHLFAHVLGYKVGTLTISFGDVHIYSNHREQVELQLMRKPRPLPTLHIERQVENQEHDIPGLRFSGARDALLGMRYEDLKLEGYKPHPKIAAPVAV
jgi:thymidylate synthase